MPHSYELVVVERSQQQLSAPVLTELDRLDFSSLEVRRVLGQPGTISATMSTRSIADPVKNRLRDLTGLPSELRVYRGSNVLEAGPIASVDSDRGQVTITARTLLQYVAFWYILADQIFTNTDQFVIVKNLIDYWQNQDYGNFGLDTSSIGTSGVNRDRSYLGVETKNILEAITQLANVESGFDVDVDPSTRAVVLHHPEQGSDLSSSVILDSRNLVGSRITDLISPDDVASLAFGVGATEDLNITSQRENASLMSTFGRVGVVGSFHGVSVQSTLDDHVQEMLDSRAEPMISSSPVMLPTDEDIDEDALDIGDKVSIVVDSGLGQRVLARRVASKIISVQGARVTVGVELL